MTNIEKRGWQIIYDTHNSSEFLVHRDDDVLLFKQCVTGLNYCDIAFPSYKKKGHSYTLTTFNEKLETVRSNESKFRDDK